MRLLVDAPVVIELDQGFLKSPSAVRVTVLGTCPMPAVNGGSGVKSGVLLTRVGRRARTASS